MVKSTSDSILGVIWKESWILDHFELQCCVESICLAEVCAVCAFLVIIVLLCFHVLLLAYYCVNLWLSLDVVIRLHSSQH